MEPIKQEIINNIFENGDKLITGPILQTVLIDMIDDVNVKDQEILSKTGSWDNAVTQIPNLATKTELTEAKNNLQANITNLSESVARDLENVDSAGYATETWVQSQGYLKEHQDISNLATKSELTAAENNLQGNITSLSESVARDLANVDVDLTGYATEQWVESKGYLTEHQDISNLATKAEVTNLSESVARDLASVPEGVATEAWVQSQDYASKTYVNNAVSSSSVDLTGYATETWVQSQGYLKEHQDISNLATKGELNSVSQSVQTDISNLATKSELTSVSESVQTDITNLSESVANSAVWKKGTGTDSIAQVIAKGTNPPTATGNRAIATGQSTYASGECSHAEGYRAIASGWTSHAEGFFTEASNSFEHAQGRYNHSSTNQIFSIGTGNSGTDRRNAISVLEVDNSGSYTSSFFVQNIGGYDGTNPTPGTNDLATVINGMSTGGGSSETLWKKGEGQDSIVQAIADGTNLPTATGNRAVAIGYATTASGDSSHAEGRNTKANQNYSHVEGEDTVASGWGSHAEGIYTEASGQASHAEGNGTTALGDYSHTEGQGAQSPGNASHAEGHYTNASGFGSHAEGYYTIASNNYEHAQGRWNLSSENQIFSIGTGNSDSDRRNVVSVLEVSNNNSYTGSVFVQNVGGYDGTNPHPGTNDLATVINGLSSGGGSSETLWKKGTGTDSVVQILTGDNEAKTPTATGTGSVAIGLQTTASANYSHAEGQNTKASGYYSHAEGSNTIASGKASHAEGDNAKASGWYSHAEGNTSNASGDWSHAEGNSTKASGFTSHAEGNFTIASNQYEHAQGRYNHNSENQIFSIGTGNSDTDRRNAVSVLEVNNNNSYTSSFFVQNIGGYDGTNPEPGTNDLATVINNLPSGGGSSEVIWKKGTGQDSIVQKVTSISLTEPIASGVGAVAIGDKTKASSWSSHAEGGWTEAQGNRSHAEGSHTRATGEGSHAEGYFAVASNNYEHAQGRWNLSSENQIFSVGAGDGDPGNPESATRRNAISVLAVTNSDTQITTASVFIQNVGGYDGTNPTPGTNDLATVISNLPSGGTSSETWTFTLDDGSTVTKNIVMR